MHVNMKFKDQEIQEAINQVEAAYKALSVAVTKLNSLVYPFLEAELDEEAASSN